MSTRSPLPAELVEISSPHQLGTFRDSTLAIKIDKPPSTRKIKNRRTRKRKRQGQQGGIDESDIADRILDDFDIIALSHIAFNSRPNNQHEIADNSYDTHTVTTNKMPFHIRPATEADLPAIGFIGREAFRPKIGQIMFPPHLSHRTMENTDPAAEGGPFIDEQTFQLKRLEKRLRMTTTVVLVETKDGDVQDGGEIVGYAHWEVPKSSTFAPALSDETEKEGQEVEPVPPTYDREANRRIGEEFEAETKKALGENGYKDMWYLAVLSVHPSHQRKGVGKKLLQWGMERAAEENTPVFLLSSPEGYPLYLSQGFRTLKEFMLCGTLPSFSMILSPPGSADGSGSI